MAQKIPGVPSVLGHGKRRGPPPPRRAGEGVSKRPGEKAGSQVRASEAEEVEQEEVEQVQEETKPGMDWLKRDLLAYAEKADVDVDDSMTKAQVIAAIEAA